MAKTINFCDYEQFNIEYIEKLDQDIMQCQFIIQKLTKLNQNTISVKYFDKKVQKCFNNKSFSKIYFSDYLNEKKIIYQILSQINIPDLKPQLISFDDQCQRLIYEIGQISLKEIMHLKKDTWTDEEILFIADILLEYCLHLFNSDIYYTDWKPQNIMFQLKEDLKIKIQLQNMENISMHFNQIKSYTKNYCPNIHQAQQFSNKFERLQLELYQIGICLQQLIQCQFQKIQTIDPLTLISDLEITKYNKLILKLLQLLFSGNITSLIQDLQEILKDIKQQNLINQNQSPASLIKILQEDLEKLNSSELKQPTYTIEQIIDLKDCNLPSFTIKLIDKFISSKQDLILESSLDSQQHLKSLFIASAIEQARFMGSPPYIFDWINQKLGISIILPTLNQHQNSLIYTQLGQLYYSIEDFQQSQEMFEKAQSEISSFSEEKFQNQQQQNQISHSSQQRQQLKIKEIQILQIQFVIAYHLGQLWMQKKKFEIAEENFLKSKKILQEYINNIELNNLSEIQKQFNIFDLIPIQIQLGFISLEKGCLSQAQNLFTEAYKLSLQQFNHQNDPHPDIAIHLNNFGRVLATQCQFKEAEDCYKASLMLKKQCYNQHLHPSCISSLELLGSLYTDQGRFGEAEYCLQGALSIVQLQNSKQTILFTNSEIQQIQTNSQSISENQMKDQGIKGNQQENQKQQKLQQQQQPFSTLGVRIQIQLSRVYRQQGFLQAATDILNAALTQMDNYQNSQNQSQKQQLQTPESSIKSKLVENNSSQGKKTENNLKLQKLASEIQMSLAQLQLDQGLLKEAMKTLQSSLEKKQAIYGPESSALIEPFSLAGSILQEQGNLQEAESYYEKAVVIYKKKVLFYTEQLQQQIKQKPISQQQKQQQVPNQQSQPQNQQSPNLHQQEQQHSPQQHDFLPAPIIDIYIQLGNINQTKGKLKKAETYYKNAQEVVQKLYRHNHPALAGPQSSLGQLYLSQGRLEEAEQHLHFCIDLLQKSYGPDLASMSTPVSAQLASCVGNLGLVYMDLDKLDQAEEQLTRAIKIFTISSQISKAKDKSSKDPISFPSLPQFSFSTNSSPFSFSNPTQTNKTVSNSSSTSSSDKQRLAQFIGNLGLVYYSQNRLEAAEEQFQKAIELKQQAQGADHPSIAIQLGNLGNVYQDEGKYEKAEKCYLRAIELTIKGFGEDNPALANLFKNIGVLYQQGLHKNEQAEYYYRRAIVLKQKLYGENEQSLISNYEYLAEVLRDTGKKEEAKHWYFKALVLVKNIFGQGCEKACQLLDEIQQL